ncbi:MAG: hypothetical protein ACXVBU_14930 [Ktedonobacteraceae bacterium]
MNQLKMFSFLRGVVPLVFALLLMAGTFMTASAWQGGDWKIVPSPNRGTGDNELSSVAAVSANDGWAVGYSTNNAGPYQTLIQHWNGTTWNIVSSPNPGTAFNNLYGVAAISARNVWAVGAYHSGENGGVPRTLIEHWNGSRWSVVSSPNAGDALTWNSLSTVAGVSKNNVWAVGYVRGSLGVKTLIEHWNGKVWSIVPSPNVGPSDNLLTGVAAVTAKNVWAVGYYFTDSSHTHSRSLIEHWNGARWSVVPTPNPGSINDLSGVAVRAADDVWAVGESSSGSNSVQTLIEHWNGKAWSLVPSPHVGFSSGLGSVTAISAHDVWALGQYEDTSLHREQVLIEHWDGKIWRVVPSPNVANADNYLHGVVRVPATNHVWTVGSSRGHSAPYTLRTLIEFKG